MKKGKVKWFNAQKGYGFITADDGKEIFCHYSALNMDGFKVITEGQNVEFDVVEGKNGSQAANVTIIQ